MIQHHTTGRVRNKYLMCLNSMYMLLAGGGREGARMEDVWLENIMGRICPGGKRLKLKWPCGL